MAENSCIQKIFAKNYQSAEQSAKREFKELCIYIVFLAATTIVAVSAREIGMYYFNHTIHRLFLERSHLLIEYEDLVTTEDWWLFTETTFIESVRHLNLPNSLNDSSPTGNILLGVPRLRQIRVQSEPCQHDILKASDQKCYGPYKKQKEDKSEFLNAKHLSQGKLRTYMVRGEVANYVGAGFVEMLTANHDENEDILKRLQNASWIDGGTRAVLIEFVLFNNNVNLFCNVKLLAEIPATGGLYTCSILQSIKYSPLWNEKGMIVPFFTLVFFVLIFYYTFRVIQKIVWIGCGAFLCSTFHICDIAVLVFGYFALIYVIWHAIYLRIVFDEYFENPETFFSLDIICFWNLVFIDSMGLMAFIAWIGILQYIKFNKTMVQFSITLQRCSKDLLGFGIMFSIVFVAYAYCALLFFGAVLADFDKFSSAVITLIRTVLGDFDYDKMSQANRILGPIFFLSFILLVFFILMNMFLAIIVDTYSDVKSEITHGEKNYFEEYLKSLVQKLTNKVSPSKTADENLKNPVVEESRDGKTSSMPSETSIPTRSSQNQSPVFKEEIFNSLFEILAVDKDYERNSLETRVAALETKMEKLIEKIDEVFHKSAAKPPRSGKRN